MRRIPGWWSNEFLARLGLVRRKKKQTRRKPANRCCFRAEPLEPRQMLSMAPTEVTPFTSIDVLSDAPDTRVPLAHIFAVDPGAEVVYSIQSNSGPELVTPSIDQSAQELVLDYAQSEQGLPTVVVRATNSDDGQYVDHKVLLSVGYLATGPRIASLVSSPEPVVEGDPLQLEARHVVGASNPCAVQFYLDSNANAKWDTQDTLLGTDLDASDGWAAEVSTVGIGAGEHLFFARATDTNGLVGNAARLTVSVASPTPDYWTLLESGYTNAEIAARLIGTPGVRRPGYETMQLDPVPEVGDIALDPSSGLGEGQQMDLAAEFTDASESDTHWVTINWGDGTTTRDTLDVGSGQYVLDGDLTPVSTVESLVQAAFNNRAWDGKGITSSTAAATPWPYAVGYMRNGDLGPGAYSTWFGCAVNSNSVLLRLAYFGDADLDGEVTDADYNRWLTGSQNNLTGWINGDFNYDGSIDTDDFDLWRYAVSFGYDALPAPTSTGGQFADIATMVEPTTNDPGTISAVHTYADNQSTPYTITVTVTNAADGEGSNTTTVSVANVAPTATFRGGTVPPATDGTVSFTNQFEPSSADRTAGLTYSYDFDNDGTFETTGSSSASATVSSSYLSGFGAHQVKGRISDKDGGHTDYTVSVVVSNISAAITGLPTNNQSVRGSQIALGSTVSDPGASGPFSYLWHVEASNGQTIADGTAATYSFTPTVRGTYTVTLAVTDEYGGVSQDSQAITVINPVPAINGNSSVNEGASYTLNLAPTETGNPHHWTIAWGDGQTEEVAGSPASATHTYADNGSYSISATALMEEPGDAGLDPGFAYGGATYTTGSGFKAVSVGTDGEIYALGSTSIRRFTPDGEEDGSFTSISGSIGMLVRQGGQSDELLVARTTFSVLAYTPDGDRVYVNDTPWLASFTFPPSVQSRAASDLLVDASGNIVVVGRVTHDGLGYVGVVRYDSSGHPDTSFGSGGLAVDNFSQPIYQTTAVAIQADGKIVVAGIDEDGQMVLVRFTANGQLDGSFGSSGRITMGVEYAANYPDGLVIQPDGKIVVTNSYRPEAAWSTVLYRFNVDGSPDTGFSSSSLSAFRAEGLVLQADGKLLATGGYLDSTGNNFALARYLPGGGLDTDFGDEGVLTTALYNGSTQISSSIKAVVLEEDGQLLAVGTGSGIATYSVVARYNLGCTPTVASGSPLAVTVNNVAPTATFGNSGAVNEGSEATVSFTASADPSTADTAAGLHYSIALTQGALATSYAAAGTDTSAPFTWGTRGSYTVYGRIFDKNDGYTSYQTTVEVNGPPVQTTRFASIDEPQDASDSVLDLWDMFSDVESDPQELIYSIQENDQPSGVSASINQTTGQLTISYVGSAWAYANITVRATDSMGLYADHMICISKWGVGPRIASLAATLEQVEEGENLDWCLNLQAMHVVGGASARGVAFYRDLNGDRQPQWNEWLGTDDSPIDGWTLLLPVNRLGEGDQGFLAQAVDTKGRLGNVAKTIANVTAPQLPEGGQSGGDLLLLNGGQNGNQAVPSGDLGAPFLAEGTQSLTLIVSTGGHSVATMGDTLMLLLQNVPAGLSVTFSCDTTPLGLGTPVATGDTAQWMLPFNTANLVSGKHTFSAVVTTSDGTPVGAPVKRGVWLEAATSNSTLQGHWELDNSVAIEDASGNGYAGTIVGEPTALSDYAEGGLYFDGSSGINLPADVFDDGPVAISVWVRPTSEDLSGTHVIVNHAGLVPGTGMFLRINGDDNKYEFGIGSGTNEKVTVSGVSADVGNWVHLVGVYDGNAPTPKWILYRNGNESPHDAIAGLPSFEGAWSIGGSVSPGNRFVGGISDVRIYRGTLTGTDVGELHSQKTGLSGITAVANVNGTVMLTAAVAGSEITGVDFYRDGNGDGILEPGVDIAVGTGSVSGNRCVFNAPVPPDAGTYTYFAAIPNARSNTIQSVSTTIVDPRPTAIFGSPGSVEEGSTATVSFTNPWDPLAANRAAGYTYAYDLDGDGRFESSGVSADIPSNLLEDGPVSITVRGRITNARGDFRVYTTTIEVLGVAPTAEMETDSLGSVGVNVPVAVALIHPSDPSVADTAAGFRYSFALDRSDLATSYDNAGDTIRWTTTFPDAGTYTVWARILDRNNQYSDYSTDVVVKAPQVSGAAKAVVDSSYALCLDLADPTVVGGWSIDWGDNNVEVVCGSPSAVTHQYASTGSRQIRATAILGGGQLDGDFAGTGQFLDLAGGKLVAVAVGSTGEIFALGDNDFVYCYKADGQASGSFHITTITDPTTIAVQHIGGRDRILVANDAFQVAAYTIRGKLDSRFGPNLDGRTTFTLPTSISQPSVHSILVDSAGNLFVTGTVKENGNQHLAVVGFDATGRVAPGFGSGGLAVDYSRNVLFASFALSPSGDIYAMATVDRGPVLSPEIQRSGFNANNGQSFGLVALALLDSQILGIAFQANSPTPGIIGLRSDATDGVTLFRYLSGADIDTAFGTVQVPGLTSATSLLVQPDGKILVGGTASNAGTNRFAVVRFLPDGGLDMSFGAGGTALTHFYDSKSEPATSLNGMVLTQDGLVAVGAADISGHAALARYKLGYQTAAPLAVDVTTLDSATNTTTTLTSSSDWPGANEEVTFTATVLPTNVDVSAIPTGTVQFMIGGTPEGSPVDVGPDGTATFTRSFSAGQYTITATFTPRGHFTTSTWSNLAQRVGGSSQTILSVASWGVYGHDVMFTAQVSAVNPTGDVEFFDGDTYLGTATLANGTATLTASTLPVVQGGHTITAVYLGNATLAGSSSTPETLTINAASPTITLVSPTYSAVYGQPVEFIATVTATGNADTPGGTVQFKEGSNVLAEVPLDGFGVATWTTASLPVNVAPHTITAHYLGNGNFSPPSSAASRSVTISSADITVGLDSTSSLAQGYGRPITLTAWVDATLGGAILPGGLVTFLDGTTELGTALLDDTGTASLTVSTLAVGSHQISASYPGDGNFAAGTSPIIVQAVAIPTTTAVCLPNNGLTLTATVAVTDLSGGTPGGSVMFFDGGIPLGEALLDGHGIATLTMVELAAGQHAFTAAYEGDGWFGGSESGELAQLVAAARGGTNAPATSQLLDETPLMLLESAAVVVRGPDTWVTGMPVTFTSSVTATNPVYAWTVYQVKNLEYLSIATSVEADLTFTPPELGYYEVQLHVTDGGNAPATTTVSLITTPPVVEICATDPFASQRTGDPGQFTITRRGATDADLTVSYRIVGWAEIGSEGNFARTETVTILAHHASASIDLQPIVNQDANGTFTVYVRLDPVYWPSKDHPSESTLWVYDKDAPALTIVATAPRADEATLTPGQFRIATSQAPLGTVGCAVTGTAIPEATNIPNTPNANCRFTDSNVVYLPESRILGVSNVPTAVANVNLEPIANENYEGDTTVTLSLGEYSIYTGGSYPLVLGEGKATVTVVDDDLPVVSIGDVTVYHGDNAIFHVTLSCASRTDVTVWYATSNGIGAHPGQAGTDYVGTAKAQKLVIPAGRLGGSIIVSTLSGATTGDQFTVRLTNPDGCRFSTQPSPVYVLAGTATISDAYGKLVIDSLNVSSDLPNPGNNGDLEKYLDQIKADPSRPGKILLVNDGDTDGNQLPDFADFHNDSQKFVPLVIKLSPGVDTSTARLNLVYSGSDPANLPAGSAQNGYAPNPGVLRVWTQDASVDRSTAGITNAGHYITPDTDFAASLLTGWTSTSDGGYQVVVYVEAVRPSLTLADQEITLKLAATSSGSLAVADRVRVTVLQDFAPDYTAAGIIGVAQGASGGNPMAGAYSGAVRLADGTVHLAAGDLSTSGYGQTWGVTRVWSNQLGMGLNPSFGNGVEIAELPHLIQATSAIIVVSGGQEFFFDQVSTDTYQERFFGLETLTYDTTNHQYKLADTTGTRILFNDFTIENFSDPTLGMYKRGAFKQLTDADGNTILVPDRGGYDRFGNITCVVREGSGTAGQEMFVYQYKEDGNGGERLVNITVQRSGSTIEEAQYAYHQAGGDYGNAGDLKDVTICQDAGTGGGLQWVDGYYYRYDTSGANRDALRYAVSGDNYTRLVLRSATELDRADNIVSLASYAFTYDSLHRATAQVIQGAGASSFGSFDALGKYEYTYGNVVSVSTGMNVWAHNTKITPPGNTSTQKVFQTVYTNYAGEPMLTDVFVEADSVNSALVNHHWYTFNAFDSKGRLVLTALPSTEVTPNASQYPDLLNKQPSGNYAQMSDSQGQIVGIDYYGTGTGGCAGYVMDTYLRHGESGTKVLQSYYQYTSAIGDGVTIHPVEYARVYSEVTDNPANSSARTTRYDYTFAGLHASLVKTYLPQVGADQNGNDNNMISTFFDESGRVQRVTDAEGYDTVYVYDDPTGAVKHTSTEVGDGPDMITKTVVDALGRPTSAMNWVDGQWRSIFTTVYSDDAFCSTTTTYPPKDPSTGAPLGPIVRVVSDRVKGTIETLSTVPGSTTAGDLRIVSKTWVDYAGRTLKSQRYDGYSDSPYESEVRYDDAGRAYWAKNAVGTITKTEYDGLGRPTFVWNGTTSGLGLVQRSLYDNNGVGDGNLTSQAQFLGFTVDRQAVPDRTTRLYHDWRDRLAAQDNGVQVTYNKLNNLGEATRSEVYQSGFTVTIDNNGELPVSAAGSLRARTTTEYDKQGRAYRTFVYSVNQTNGTIDQSDGDKQLKTEIYHDGRGYVVKTKSPGGLVSKTTYDGAGRVTYQASGSESATGVFTEIESAATQYDANGYATFITQKQLNPDGTTMRTTHVARYYDEAGRLTANVDFGTNRATMTARPALDSLKGQTDFLVNSYAYDLGGYLQVSVDPKGVVTSRENDNLGRTVRQIENADPFIMSELARSLLVNPREAEPLWSRKITNCSYDGLDRVTKICVRNWAPPPQGSAQPSMTMQETFYKYSVTRDRGSDLNSCDFLGSIIYPDTTTETFERDALGQVIVKKDRNGIEHVYGYDLAGRLTSDRIWENSFRKDSAIDKTITTLKTQYDTLDHAVLLSSGKGLPSSMAVANEVKRVYNGFGQLVTEYQEHSGQVDENTTPKVQYHYVYAGPSSGNYSRLDQVTYPDSTTLGYSYGTGMGNSISRISAVMQGDTVLEQYWYLGVGTVVNSNLSEPGITRNQTFDEFGRLNDIVWNVGGTLQSDGKVQKVTGQDKNTGQDVVHLAYGYDRDGNVRLRDDVQARLDAAAVERADPGYSEVYQYNGLSYRQSVARGVYSPSVPGVRPRSALTWTTDSQGNRYSKQYGSKYNALNESESGESHAMDGSLTRVGLGHKDETTLTYDAWGRVTATVTVNSYSSGSARDRSRVTYSYDASGRRILSVDNRHNAHLHTVKRTTEEFYDGARPIEERETRTVYGSEAPVVTNIVVRNVWSPADGRLVLRDVGGQRQYAIADAQQSIVAVADSNGVVLQRYLYGADGIATSLDANWNYIKMPDWEWLYRGQRWQKLSIFEDNGLYVGASGQSWYDPLHGRSIQPDLTAFGNNPYEYKLTTWEKTAQVVVVGATVVTVVGVGIATGGLGSGAVAVLASGMITGAVGGAAIAGATSVFAGNSWEQIGKDTLIGGLAGAIGGLAGGMAGIAARGFVTWAGLGCGTGLGGVGGFIMGAAEGTAFGATEGFVRGGLTTGTWAGARHEAALGAGMGFLIGGPLGAIFHQVCFTAGTQVVVAIEEERGEQLADEGLSATGGVATARKLRYITRNIEKIAENDPVVSRNEDDPDAPLAIVRVDKIYRRLADHLRILTIRDFGGREQVLCTTDEHPFDTDPDRWKKAKDLQPGDILVGRHGACAILIATVREEHPEGIWVYNLRVPGTHTYFVRQQGVDCEPVWVHNADYESAYSVRYNPEVPGRPDPRSSIDTLTFPGGEKTAGGGLRDAGEFWKQWSGLSPESLSPRNQYLIENYDALKVSPTIDETWIKAFPEHADYLHETLVHHHLEQGRYAIPVPASTHVGSGGIWHGFFNL